MNVGAARGDAKISASIGAAAVDDFEVTDLGTLAFSDEVPAECDVFGTLPEAGFFGKATAASQFS